MTLGKKISQLRKEHSLSQDAFAEQFNVTRQTVSNWENSKSYPDLETIVKISGEFNLSTDELLKSDSSIVKKIDGEREKKNKVIGILSVLLLVISIITLGTYLYFRSLHEVDFSMTDDKTITLTSDDLVDLDIITGYFTLPASGKMTIKSQAAIDSGSLEITLKNSEKEPVYQIKGDKLADSQELQLSKGSYVIQITANDYTEEVISLTYQVSVSN